MWNLQIFYCPKELSRLVISGSPKEMSPAKWSSKHQLELLSTCRLRFWRELHIHPNAMSGQWELFSIRCFIKKLHGMPSLFMNLSLKSSLFPSPWNNNYHLSQKISWWSAWTLNKKVVWPGKMSFITKYSRGTLTPSFKMSRKLKINSKQSWAGWDSPLTPIISM